MRDAEGAWQHYGTAVRANVRRISAVSISTRYVFIASMDVTLEA
jgi:hypothetical protein